MKKLKKFDGFSKVNDTINFFHLIFQTKLLKAVIKIFCGIS
jgi:hypothetical protein